MTAEPHWTRRRAAHPAAAASPTACERKPAAQTRSRGRWRLMPAMSLTWARTLPRQSNAGLVLANAHARCIKYSMMLCDFVVTRHPAHPACNGCGRRHKHNPVAQRQGHMCQPGCFSCRMPLTATWHWYHTSASGLSATSPPVSAAAASPANAPLAMLRPRVPSSSPSRRPSPSDSLLVHSCMDASSCSSSVCAVCCDAACRRLRPRRSADAGAWGTVPHMEPPVPAWCGGACPWPHGRAPPNGGSKRT